MDIKDTINTTKKNHLRRVYRFVFLLSFILLLIVIGVVLFLRWGSSKKSVVMHSSTSSSSNVLTNANTPAWYKIEKQADETDAKNH